MPYYLLFIFLFLIALLEQFKIKISQKQFLYVTEVIILILFSGTRYDFGRDYFVYKEAFYNLNFQNYTEYLFEPLFTLLCILFRDFGFNFFVLTVASVNIISKTRLFYKQSPFPLLSLFTYYSLSVILYEMGQMRQALAMIMAFYAFDYCKKQNLKGFLLSIIVAFGLHYSAIILLPCYWISKLHISRKWILIFSTILFLLASVNLSSLILEAANMVQINHIALKITEYAGRNTSLGINASLFLRFFILFGFVYAIKNDKQYDYLAMLYLYGILLYTIFNTAPEIAMRTASYFKLLEILIYPLILFHCKLKSNRIILLFVIGIYLFYTMNNLFIDHPDAFLPYKSFIM